MRKIIKSYGNTLVITFNREDQKVYNIAEGDIVDLTDMVVIKKEE